MKRICALCICMLLLCAVFCGCEKGKLTEGSYVVLGSYSDEPIVWRVYRTQENVAYAMADRVISLKAFDASGNYELGSARAAAGSNDWEHSALRAWLNAEGDVTYVKAPSKGFVYGGLNNYEKEPGFLTAFSEKEKALLLTMGRTVYLAEKDKERALFGDEAMARKTNITEMTAMENAYQTVVNDKVSLPCATELAGTATELLSARLTDSAKEDCTGHGEAETLAYWTITPNGTSEFAQCVINADGALSDAEPRNSCIGVRPVIALSISGKGFTGSGTEEKPFVVK